MLVNEEQNQHLYVSIGHKISLETAFQIVKKLTIYETAEPIRLVDLISRKKIRKMWENDYNSAPSFEMVYLSK
jgi:deoxyinosine 3'endonuclease (endonuclease V)